MDDWGQKLKEMKKTGIKLNVEFILNWISFGSERSFSRPHQAHNELEHSLEAKIRALQNQLEVEQVECRRLQWANKDTEKEKQLEVQR